MVEHSQLDARMAWLRKPQPGIAVVVIGRNEGERRISCLSALGVHADRAVYVDSGSTDGSSVAARHLGVQVVNLDMSRPFTAARARNEGYRQAMRLWPDTAFVQFIDGDCVLDPGWLDKAQHFMAAQEDFAIVFGRRRERNVDHSVYNWLCDREWDGQPGEAVECGGDVFVRVSAFQAVGGYQDSLIAGEEPELCVRLRELCWRIWHLDDEMTLHDANVKSIRQWWQCNRRANHAFAEVSSIHWHSPRGIWKRSFLRSLGWGGALPVIVLATVTLHPAIIAMVALYPAQVAHIAARERFSAEGWRSGWYGVLGKFSEFHGAMTWMASAVGLRRQALIEYK